MNASADPHIQVTDQTGETHTIPALEGWTVMEIIRDAGLPIQAECGGACSCATCHIYLDPAWRDQFPDRSADEEEMLDLAFNVDEALSRLSCQLIFRDELSGLAVTLAPGTEA